MQVTLRTIDAVAEPPDALTGKSERQECARSQSENFQPVIRIFSPGK